MASMPSLIENSISRLLLSKTTKKGPLLSSLHHFNESTGRTKQKRADRRANIINILNIVIPQIDLDTFAWGKWFTNHSGHTDFYTRGIDYLCCESGMNERTVCRVLSDLERVGYLKVDRRDALGKDGNQIKHYSLRQFTTKFFIELGFKKKTIEDTRSWKRKKNEITFYSKKMSSTCKQGLAKIANLFKNHSKPKTAFKIPSFKYTNNNNNTRIGKNKISSASKIAEKMGISPMDVLRNHSHLLI